MVRVFPLFVALADGQIYGTGWGKTTYSVSDGNGCWSWMNEYLPVTEDRPNGAMSCGDVGRARLQTPSTGVGSSWGNPGFGLHAVHVDDSSARIHAECTPTVEFEQKLDAKLEKVYQGGEYDAFLDYNGGHWVSSLDPYVSKFTSSAVPFVTLQWKDETNAKDYYSVIVRVHNSMMLIELMSAECSSCTSAMAAPTARYIFAENEGPEDVFGSLDDQNAEKPLMHPARTSWPSSNLARERQYFADGMGAVVTSLEASDAKTDVYDFTPIMSEATMQFHIVERPASQDSLSWVEFEEAAMSCHRATIQDCACGENTMMDHHAGLGVHGNNAKLVDAGILEDLAKSLDLPFHVTLNPQGNPAVYAMAGNGLSIAMQVSAGSWVPPRDMTVGMLNLCGDGTCPTSFMA